MQPFVTPYTRRDLLRTLGAGFGSVGLAGMLHAADRGDKPRRSLDPLEPKTPHFAPKAKRVIFLFMNGGPSHVDTFDPKPMLAEKDGTPPPAGSMAARKESKLMKSPFTFKKYGEAGIEVSELYPEVGKRIDDICVIRSMVTDSNAHERALLFMNSGNMQPIRPSMGSWLTYGLGTENQNLPGFVVLCPGKPVVGPQLWGNSFLPAVYQGTHINNASVTTPKTLIRYLENPHLAPAEQREQLDLLQHYNRLHATARGNDSQLDSRIQAMEIAFRMQAEAMDVFDLAKEPASVRERYGKGEFADACLLARRMTEKGVRAVQIYYGNGQPWDDHSDILNHRKHAEKSDKPIAALLDDLKAKGLLDETIVIWSGEFGRTPFGQGAKGRDHHSLGFTTWVAGGGFKGGLAYGETDEFGIHSVKNRVHVHDLHATILHQLGIDHEKLTFRYSGRDFRLTDVHGHVVNDIIA